MTKTTHTIDPIGVHRWFKYGRLHKEDGPAVIYPDGDNYWYLNNEWVRSVKEYQEKLNLSDEDMIVLILKCGDIK